MIIVDDVGPLCLVESVVDWFLSLLWKCRACVATGMCGKPGQRETLSRYSVA